MGLQLIGAAWSEASLFGLARGYEAITADAEWRREEPTGLAEAADPRRRPRLRSVPLPWPALASTDGHHDQATARRPRPVGARPVRAAVGDPALLRHRGGQSAAPENSVKHSAAW